MARRWIAGSVLGVFLSICVVTVVHGENPIRQWVACSEFGPTGDFYDGRQDYYIPLAAGQSETGTRGPFYGGKVHDTGSGSPTTGYVMNLYGTRQVDYYGRTQYEWVSGQVRIKCAWLVDSATNTRIPQQIYYGATGWASGEAYIIGMEDCGTQITCENDDDGSGGGGGGGGGGGIAVLWCEVTTTYDWEGNITSVTVNWNACEWRYT